MTVTHETVPISVGVRTPRGARELPLITFAAMPDRDDVVLFSIATIEVLEIDLYPLALEELRPRAVPVHASEGKTIIVDAAVKCLMDRGADMLMDPAKERGARDRVLEK